MSSNSATGIASQQSIKAYVDSQVTAQDLDFQADSGGALSIDLDSETLTFTGGTGIDTSGSGNAVTFAIDSTVATLTGTQTLTNKTLTSPDINTPDIDGGAIDGATIGGSTPAAGTFTTFTSNGIDDNANATAVTINSDEDVLIGTATRSADTQVFTKSLTVKGTYDGTLELETGRSDGDNSGVGRMVFVMPTNNASARDVAQIASETDGSTANERGGSLIFSTKADNVDGVVQRLNINSGGDISFMDGSGNAGLLWDSSAAALGIGTSSPSSVLSVKSDVNNNVNNGILFEAADSTNKLLQLYENSVGECYMGFYQADVQTALIRTNGNSYFNGGNVGIGSSSATYRMNVQGSSTETNNSFASGVPGLTLTNNSATDNTYSFLAFSDTDGGGSFTSVIQGKTVSQSANTGEINFFTRSSTGFGQRMTIDSSGNVGIGTDSPTFGSGSGLEVSRSGTATVRVERTGSTACSGEFFAGNGKVVIGSTSDTHLEFRTNSQEAARIDSSGNLLVGMTSDNYLAADDGVQIKPAGNIRIGGAGTAARAVMSFVNDTAGTPAQVGSIVTSGSATTYATSSDERLKDNIVDAPSASSDIDAIQVRSFDWKADGSHQKYGMVAQELTTVAPEAVSTPEDPDEMMGVDYSKLVPMLIKEIQTLRSRVQQLEQ